MLSKGEEMQEELEGALGSLLEIAGVEGSFLFSPEGDLTAWDMPAVLEEQTLEEVTARTSRLADAFQSIGRRLDGAVVRFSEHLLCLRTGPRGTLCVLARPQVSLPALRMAARLIFRRLERIEGGSSRPSHGLPIHGSSRSSW